MHGNVHLSAVTQGSDLRDERHVDIPDDYVYGAMKSIENGRAQQCLERRCWRRPVTNDISQPPVAMSVKPRRLRYVYRARHCLKEMDERNHSKDMQITTKIVANHKIRDLRGGHLTVIAVVAERHRVIHL